MQLCVIYIQGFPSQFISRDASQFRAYCKIRSTLWSAYIREVDEVQIDKPATLKEYKPQSEVRKMCYKDFKYARIA